jgi:zinc protease
MRLILAGLASALLALGVAGQAVAQTKIPPIDYHERVLANGLHVYSVLDRTTPNVAVQMWYGVGARNDPAGRSGFAHLFEHLMFKAKRDMPAEYFDRLTEDVGGENNASTDDDYTNYYEVVPAGRLERILWAEAERLGGLVVDQAAFKSERAVVEEELRQRVLADPYGRLFQLDVPEASFRVHPYHRPSIGSIADLEAASLADVRAFHATYYRPDNASLIVVGNFDPARLDAWVDKYFGPIRRPERPIPEVTAVEPARTHPVTVDAYGPDVPLPAVVLSYPAPQAASTDAAALTVLEAVLSTGKSSRLYQALVYRDAVAQTVSAEADLRRQAGLFTVSAVLAAGRTPDQGIAALDAELARVRDAPVSAAELAAARNQLLAGVLQGRETISGRAEDIGQAIVVEGDAGRVNSDVAALQAVTPADVQRVARAWLVDRRRVVIRYRAERQRPRGQKDTLVQDSPRVAARPLPPIKAPVVVAAPPDQRQAPPPPGPPQPVDLPTPTGQTLDNGLRVIVAHTGSAGMVTATLAIRGGSASDPKGLDGLTAMAADLLTQGTTAHSAAEIAAASEALGDTLGADVAKDMTTVSLTGLSDTLPQSLPMLADVTRRPVFAQGELDRLRTQKLDAFTVSLSDPGDVAARAAGRAVFGDGPYGHTEDGSPASLKRIDREAVEAQYRRLFRPDNAILVLTGDIEPAAAFALARQAFGDWARPAEPPPAPPEDIPPPAPRILAVDVPGAGQAAVTIAGRSIQRGDADYYPVAVANAVLGGGYSARLNVEVRIKRGLSYGAESNVRAGRAVGRFTATAQTRNDAAGTVAGLMLDQIKALGAAPASQAEIDAREASLTGEYGRHAATSAGLAGDIARYAIYGVDLGEIAGFAQRVEAVTPAQAQAAAGKLVDPAGLSVVVAGDAGVFLPDLKRRFPNVALVKAADLDADVPARP